MKRRNPKSSRSSNARRRACAVEDVRSDAAAVEDAEVRDAVDPDDGPPLYPGLLFVALPVPCGAFTDDASANDDITSRALDFVLRTAHLSLSPLAMGGLH